MSTPLLAASRLLMTNSSALKHVDVDQSVSLRPSAALEAEAALLGDPPLLAEGSVRTTLLGVAASDSSARLEGIVRLQRSVNSGFSSR